jgi:hypothetical protein
MQQYFFLLLLVGLVWYASVYAKQEHFRFEVTPWKKTCLGYGTERCSSCCKAGFHGKPVAFNYCADADLSYTIAGNPINTGMPREGV